MGKRKAPVPDTPFIDRSRNNTAYWHRSMAYYKSDYGRARYSLNEWLEGLAAKPLFTEVREGHISAMNDLGVLGSNKKEDFQLTKNRERKRRRDYQRQYRDSLPSTGIDADKELLEISIKKSVCFGCSRGIEGKHQLRKPPGPPYKVHPIRECRQQANRRLTLLERREKKRREDKDKQT